MNRTVTVSIDSESTTLPRGEGFGYADFMRVWGSPGIQVVTCVDVDGRPVTLEDLTPREVLEARIQVADLGTKWYFAPEHKAESAAEAAKYRDELAVMDA